MRINKFFNDKGICSRREADKLIEAGRIRINGRVAVLGDQVEEGDKVELDGKLIEGGPKKVYLMYNKPKGITCTTELHIAGNIIDAINYPERIFPIGRLDKDSTGLIFLTNDGDIVNEILRAQYGHEKEYWVELMNPCDDAFLKKMASGVDIGDHLTLPCKVIRIHPSAFKIILTEGKNRQIRRMCEALGKKVRSLNRVRIMNVELGSLPMGKYQEIPKNHLEKIFELLKKNSQMTNSNVEVEE